MHETARICPGITTSPPPQKHYPLFLPSPPPLHQQTIQAPPFRQSPLYIGFS